MTERIYLDFNATMPLAAEVAVKMQSLLTTHYGNPSSLHWAGVPARDVVEAARCQVAGRRAGTENAASIIGLGAACQVAHDWVDHPQVVRRRDHFWQRLRERFGDQVVLNGHPERRLPNTLNVSFRGMNGHDILSKLPNVAASAGSACHAGEARLSPVLAAMGVPVEVGFGAIRFSLGRTTTQEEIDSVVEDLGHVLAQ